MSGRFEKHVCIISFPAGDARIFYCFGIFITFACRIYHTSIGSVTVVWWQYLVLVLFLGFPGKGRYPSGKLNDTSYVSLSGCKSDTVAYMVAALEQRPADSLTPDQRTWLALCGLCLQDKSYSDTIGPQSRIDSVVSYYEQTKSPYLATAYFYKARSLYYVNRYEAAVSFYLKAEKHAESVGDYSLLARINMDIGDFNVYQQYYTKARGRFQKALRYYELAHENHGVYALTSIGYSYLYDESFDVEQALHYFHEALDLAQGDSALTGLVLYEMGLVFYEEFRSDSAKYYFLQSEKISEKNYMKASRSLCLANIYHEEGKQDSVLYHLDAALAAASDIYVSQECYEMKAILAQQAGDYEEANRYRELELACLDSIGRIERSHHEAYVYEHNYHKEQERLRERNTWITAGMVVLVLIGLFALIGLFEFLEKKRMLEHYEGKGRQAEQERDSWVAELFEVQKQKIQAHMETLQKHGTDYETALRTAYNEMLRLDSFPDFCKFADSYLNNLLTKLHVEYPQLDERDLKLCVLHLLQTRNKEISLLLNISVNSVGNTKTRLAKKVGAGSATGLTRLLYDIFARRE